MEWILVILAGIGIYIAYRQYKIMQVQSAVGKSTAPPPAPLPDPRIITQAELGTRTRDLRAEWEIKAPTADIARGRYLQQGWERDEIDGHPLVYESMSGNWIVRRRPPVHGLSEASVAALVAMRRNRNHADAFEYTSGGVVDHLVTSVREWQGDEAMSIREQLLTKGLVLKEPQEYNRYILTELGRIEVERLIQAGA